MRGRWLPILGVPINLRVGHCEAFVLMREDFDDLAVGFYVSISFLHSDRDDVLARPSCDVVQRFLLPLDFFRAHDILRRYVRCAPRAVAMIRAQIIIEEARSVALHEMFSMVYPTNPG